MSIGEDRVRITFNPSDNSMVSQIKQKTAELINLCEQLRGFPDGGEEDSKDRMREMGRLLSLAQTHYENAAMWAVKAVTL